MSHAGLLERVDIHNDDLWIELDPPSQTSSTVSPVLAAIAAAQASIQTGRVAEAEIDLDSLGDLDELDDAAIRAFFEEND